MTVDSESRFRMRSQKSGKFSNRKHFRGLLQKLWSVFPSSQITWRNHIYFWRVVRWFDGIYLWVFFVANRLHFYADTSEEADLKIWIPSSRHVERSVSKTFRAPYRRSACAFRAHISSSDVPIAESIYRIGQIRYLLSERIWTSSSIIECAHWILSS